jgi:hypothetical protein
VYKYKEMDADVRQLMLMASSSYPEEAAACYLRILRSSRLLLLLH